MPENNDTTAPTHQLEALHKALGPAQPGALDAVLAGHDEQDLVRLGGDIHTSRIVTDDARLYGEAHQFWTQASESQRKKLRLFSHRAPRKPIGPTPAPVG